MHVFLDLDGTLIDSRPGIARCFAHALERLGHQAPSEAQLAWCIGPPLAVAFRRLLDTEDAGLVERGIAAYREEYEAGGMFECALYPGTREGIEAFAGAGRLRLVTSKPRDYALRIVEHFGLAGAFEAVHGPSLAVRAYGKADLIAAALAEAAAAAASAVMIGDRGEDVAGARAHGLRAVRARWGYGPDEEFTGTRPDYAARDLPDAAAWLATSRLTGG